ncbi:hypothetical protein LEP1GSC137_3409 [Leptospira borgpetersenii str. Noumea 25]|uniref:Uncharacterized protein n=1 Tax=Leptospira borgpetersenii serovar Ballum TaxID=280505 RepID=A0A0S2IS31_LEPBO|nr:hypothetical protein LBBP_02215 [Leptospira borgpetersenii serovar Ballum]EKR01516.1 hypothetical protein LEP1GSC121_4215 [Leptospira borgpetersenii serovar Castellonis str. 200801910]EMO11288.1 hypothetical protein LEP1GSC137_3409 [Leptospira borgpetersenii str. Noumea 25]
MLQLMKRPWKTPAYSRIWFENFLFSIPSPKRNFEKTDFGKGIRAGLKTLGM